MDARLDFVDASGTPGQACHLLPVDGRYLLPRLVITASPEAWIEDVTIACELTPPDARFQQALLAAWEGSGPSGHGTQLSSEQRWLSAEPVPRQAEARVRWVVSYYDCEPYERFINSVEPMTQEASVTVTFETPPEAPSATTGEPVKQEDRGPAHLGHVAVDFGTSNCTATLFDQQFLPARQPLSREQVRQLRTKVLELVDNGPSPASRTQAEFFEFLADITSVILPDASGTDSALREQLRKTVALQSSRGTQCLYSLLVELERSLSQCSEDLRPQLAAALNNAYSRSWREPPLNRLRLFGVMLDPIEGAVIESKATATLDPLRVRVGRTSLGVDDDENDRDQLVYAGLKQRLGSSWAQPELGPDMTSDDLIRECLRDIIGRCDTFIAAASSEIGKGKVNQVVITFPTMASPKVRQKLRDLIAQLGISLVDASFDEAIAAAMFTMLRDFGGDHDIGLELLRSQSRPEGTFRWKQNLLVIDIGGGTTDIALLRLHLSDQTPSDLDPVRHGRYYQLLPEVLGSTGRLQLGGELTSLRVFYWIKAMLADRLLETLPDSFENSQAQLRQLSLGQPDETSLQERTWEQLPPSYSSDGGTGVFDVLDGIVPTRARAGDGHLSQAFWLLWTLADETKRQFFAADAPDQIVLSAEQVRQMLRAAEWPPTVSPPPDVQSIPDDALTITLAKKEFEELVRRDLEEIMELAYCLAQKRLGEAGQDPEPIDRIILTGQASQAPLVKQCLLDVFGNQKTRGRSVPWRASTVVVEQEYAKLATSLGACWAKSNQGFAPMPEGARRRLLEGRNEFRIVVDNLFFNLPCAFLRGTTLGGPADGDEILPIGAELYQSDPDQEIAVIRSPQFELVDDVAVYREVYLPVQRQDQEGRGDRPLWGDFQWRVRDQEQQLNLNQAIWPHQILAQVEATSNLDLFLLLSRGRAHYHVTGESISVLNAAAAAGVPAGESSGQPVPAFDPERIVVNAYSTDGDHEGEPIFAERGSPGQPTAEHMFPETFHAPAPDGSEETMSGVISKPLPDPPANGSWTFHYLDRDGGQQQIGRMSPPARMGQLAIRYFASVDEHGNLRVHAGDVPCWSADSLAEVQDRPGSVLRTPMLATGKDYEASRDPFSGRH